MIKLEGIFKNIFKEVINLSATTTANDVNSWDSLNHIILLKEIEKEFEFEFDLFDIIELKNIGDIVQYIQTKICNY